MTKRSIFYQQVEERKRKLADLWAEGKSPDEIAEIIHIEPETVKNYATKMGLRTGRRREALNEKAGKAARLRKQGLGLEEIRDRLGYASEASVSRVIGLYLKDHPEVQP